MLIQAFIDDQYFAHVTGPDSGASTTRLFIDTVSKLQSDKIRVSALAGGFDAPTGIDGANLGELVFGAPDRLGLDQSDVRDLIVVLGRCYAYTAAEYADQYRSTTPGAPTQCLAYGAIWHSDRDLWFCALVLKERVSFVATIGFEDATKDCYLIAVVRDVTAMYRYLLEDGNHSDTRFPLLSGLAFPEILFSSDLKPTAASTGANGSISTVVGHLAFLNDDYCRVAQECGWDLPRIQAVARASGVELSDESSNTKNDKKKIRQRTVVFKGEKETQEYCCTLHTKIEATRGRIYFSVERLNGKPKVCVGIFHEHLPV